VNSYIDVPTATLIHQIADDCWRPGQHPDSLDLKAPGDGMRVRVIRTAVERAVAEAERTDR
jgi:hypothetical protein